MKKAFRRWTAAAVLGASLSGYASAEGIRDSVPSSGPQKSIVILYENDVHCAIDGYTKLAGLRDAIAASDTAYVAVTSSGDFLNGTLPGTVSAGEYIVDIMRRVGYDAVTIGNHEFDFGSSRMIELMPHINAPVICANFFKEGVRHPFYPGGTVKTFGEKRIGFVGVCTPESMVSEAYSFFDKNGRRLYDLCPDDVVTPVQHAVDSVRRAGADYVVVLSHLGEIASDDGIDSHTLVSRIRGVDAVLDGHTHSVVPCAMVQDLTGREITVSQTGTLFEYIGKLLITADGRISASLIPVNDITYTNPYVTAATDSIRQLMSSVFNTVIGHSDFELTVNDSRGQRLVRKGETNLGDLCADVFRESCHADIGLVNGGGIRNSIPAGRITFGDAVNALPYYNFLCKIEVTGATLLSMLKKCTERYPQEDGSFPHVAGMKFTLRASDHTVRDVQVMNRETSRYEPLRPDGKYTVGVSDYCQSGGFYGLLKGAVLTEQTTDITYTVLSNYIKDTLGGDVSAYRHPQGRIIIED